MPINTVPLVTIGGEAYVERVAKVICTAFAVDALNRAVLLQLDSLPNDAEISIERRIRHFTPSIQNSAKSGSLLMEAGNWAAAAVWYVNLMS
jgi:hypothetical protein